VGGNPGTTLGAQRLYIFQYAADIWSRVLPSSVTIVVRAQFAAQTCTATSATLGSAGTTTIHANFAGAPLANYWYNQALANKYFGSDLSVQPDINATFNLSIDAGCFGPGQVWYYGTDGLEGTNIELLPVVLHEIGHGLGFQTFTKRLHRRIQHRAPLDLRPLPVRHREQPALGPEHGGPARRLRDQRRQAGVGRRGGEQAGDDVPRAPAGAGGELAGRDRGHLRVQTATFGTALTLGGATGNVVLADDGVAPNSGRLHAAR
jgi:hypothetical protein